jgi:hypothetical protein
MKICEGIPFLILSKQKEYLMEIFVHVQTLRSIRLRWKDIDGESHKYFYIVGVKHNYH